MLAADGRDGPQFGCEYVMVDDGHQTAIGDWLSTNVKSPSGMAEVAHRITTEGFDAGIWWAPFLASARSEVAAAHPDWLVRNDCGRPIVGLLNPGWGLTTPMRVLATPHPEVLDHLTQVAATIGGEWGYGGSGPVRATMRRNASVGTYRYVIYLPTGGPDFAFAAR